MLILINGVFFQNLEFFQSKPGADWSEFIIKSGMFQTTFHGLIAANEGGIGEGEMIDYYGSSTLTEVKMIPDSKDPTTFEFTKQYDNRSDAVYYRFLIKQGNLWTGRYTGRDVGTGIVQCMIQAVDEKLFDLMSAHTALGDMSPFEISRQPSPM